VFAHSSGKKVEFTEYSLRSFNVRCYKLQVKGYSLPDGQSGFQAKQVLQRSGS
jgi:hypothetical protein